MEKKYYFLFLVIFSLAPLLAFAAIRGANDCCLLAHDFTDVDPACVNARVVGPVGGAKWCDINGDGNADALTANTINWGTCCFMDTVYSVSDYFFWIFFVAAAVIFIIAGYLLLFSGGSPQKNEQGKGFLFWGVIALIIVVMAKIIPAIVKAVAV